MLGKRYPPGWALSDMSAFVRPQLGGDLSNLRVVAAASPRDAYMLRRSR